MRYKEVAFFINFFYNFSGKFRNSEWTLTLGNSSLLLECNSLLSLKGIQCCVRNIIRVLTPFGILLPILGIVLKNVGYWCWCCSSFSDWMLFVLSVLDWNKYAQCGSCEFQLYLRTLSTIVWETASQIALRNCSKVVREEVSIYVILKNGTYSQAHICVKGYC